MTGKFGLWRTTKREFGIWPRGITAVSSSRHCSIGPPPRFLPIGHAVPGPSIEGFMKALVSLASVCTSGWSHSSLDLSFLRSQTWASRKGESYTPYVLKLRSRALLLLTRKPLQMPVWHWQDPGNQDLPIMPSRLKRGSLMKLRQMSSSDITSYSSRHPKSIVWLLLVSR